MSVTPAPISLPVVRGATWEDTFGYTDDRDLPIDLTGYEARMQVRTEEGQYGLSGADTLVMELSTQNGRLTIDVPETGVVAIKVAAVDTIDLNPQNEKKTKLTYSVELFIPAGGGQEEYVIPLSAGKLTIFGETTR